MKDVKKILVVDDDENVCSAIKDILELEGLAIAAAENGHAGLKKLGEEEFHLVISDVIMPDMDGIEFLRKMRKLNKKIPVLIISGDELGVQFFKSAQLLGAKDCLLKPFTRKQLTEMIEKVFQ